LLGGDGWLSQGTLRVDAGAMSKKRCFPDASFSIVALSQNVPATVSTLSAGRLVCDPKLRLP
jgi:hypothetical protein